MTLAPEVLWSGDDSNTVASYYACAPNPHWPVTDRHTVLEAYVEARIERIYGVRGPKVIGYHASCTAELADEMRSQWNVRRTFTTRDEAAKEAADFVLAATALVEASLRGEPVTSPDRAIDAAGKAAMPPDVAVRDQSDWLARFWLGCDWREFVQPVAERRAA